MACSQAAQKGRGKTGELTAGGEPGQTVPAPTVSPFWGEPRLSQPHGVPGGAPANDKAVATRTKKGNHKANRPLKEAVWASFEGRFPVVCRGDFCGSPIPRGTDCPLPAGGLPRCHARRVWKPCAAGARLNGRGPWRGAKGNAGPMDCCAWYTRMWGLRASGAWDQASTASTSCSAGAASAGMRLPSTGFPSTVRVRRPFSSPAWLRMWMR